MEINDIDIIIEVLDGNTDKFAILIDKYKNKIFKIETNIKNFCKLAEAKKYSERNPLEDVGT